MLPPPPGADLQVDRCGSEVEERHTHTTPASRTCYASNVLGTLFQKRKIYKGLYQKLKQITKKKKGFYSRFILTSLCFTFAPKQIARDHVLFSSFSARLRIRRTFLFVLCVKQKCFKQILQTDDALKRSSTLVRLLGEDKFGRGRGAFSVGESLGEASL